MLIHSNNDSKFDDISCIALLPLSIFRSSSYHLSNFPSIVMQSSAKISALTLEYRTEAAEMEQGSCWWYRISANVVMTNHFQLRK